MAYQLGIDLGTTYTAAAVCRSSDHRWVEPEVVTLGTRSATVPSVLFVAPDGAVVVGEAAERRALTDPGRVVREFKRRIGDPTPVVVAGRAWAPEQLSARLVRWVADRVAEREGGPADRIAITHPASWGAHKKDLLGEALAAHGLTVTFLAEPQAAALHYASAERVGVGSTIAVYDLGGGTFDAAVVRKSDPAAAPGAAGFGLLGRPQGLERLGGIDFDEAVFEHVREGMPDAFDELDDTDPTVLSAVARVRRECTEAKEALSSDTDVSIPVLLPAARGSVRLHRSEFEAMIRPQVEETVAALRGAVNSAGLAPEQLTAVLLVGGSSRIPLVAQLVSEQLGRPVAVDADPKNAIAKGAALAVSPIPTASWPGVSIPPVPAPPRPAPTPPARPMQPAAAYLSHEPATALLPATSPQPLRHQPEPEWDPEPEPEERRRPTGLMVGLGGLLAVAAVVTAMLLWPDGSSSPGLGTDVGSNGVTPTSEVPAPAAPAPSDPDTDTGRGGNGSGDTPTRTPSDGNGRVTSSAPEPSDAVDPPAETKQPPLVEPPLDAPDIGSTVPVPPTGNDDTSDGENASGPEETAVAEEPTTLEPEQTTPAV